MQVIDGIYFKQFIIGEGWKTWEGELIEQNVIENYKINKIFRKEEPKYFKGQLFYKDEGLYYIDGHGDLRLIKNNI